MSVPVMIAYGATFLVTSASMNYLNKTLKSALPEIDMDAIENTSPLFATALSNASTIYSLSYLGLTIYTGHYAASQVGSFVGGIEVLASMEVGELVAAAAPHIPGYQAIAHNFELVVVPFQNLSLTNIFSIAEFIPVSEVIKGLFESGCNLLYEGYANIDLLINLLDGGDSIIDGLYGIESTTSSFSVFDILSF